MGIDHDDVSKLVKILDRSRYDNVSLDADGLCIAVEWLSAPNAPANPAPQAVTGTALEIHEVGPSPHAGKSRELRVTAPAVGRLVWSDGTRPSPGDWVDAGGEVASIEAGERRTAVVVPESGRIVFVREFGSGDLVSYGQWLFVVDAV